MTWAQKYIGLPFAEGGRGPASFDCWGLVAHVLRAERGIEVEPFADIGTYDSPAIAERVAAEIARTVWQPVERADARPFDVAVMWVARRLMGRETARTLSHIGIVAAPNRLLHIERETRAVCVRFSHPSIAWRLHSFYRHRGLA